MPGLVIVLFVAVAICSIVWHFSRSRSLLEQWARDNDYEVISREYRNFFKGPFFWTSTKGQTVYYVTIRDADGNVRSGWLRCGGFWGGLL